MAAVLFMGELSMLLSKEADIDVVSVVAVRSVTLLLVWVVRREGVGCRAENAMAVVCCDRWVGFVRRQIPRLLGVKLSRYTQR